MNTKKILVYLLLLLCSFQVMAQAVRSDAPKSVLILFSGSHEFNINRQMFIALENELKPNNIKLVSDYLGDNNSVLLRDQDLFLEFFIKKYGLYRKFDLVIAFNKKAIDLCQEYGNILFPNTTILNLDIFDKKIFYPPIAEEIEVISNLHEKLEYLLIVSDNSSRGEILKSWFKDYFDSQSNFKGEVVYLDFAQKRYSDISEYEYHSTKNSVVLLLSAYQDLDLNKKEFYEQVDFFSNELGLPIYSIFDKGEDKVVGGYYFDVEAFAEHFSSKIILVLNNIPIEHIALSDLGVFQLYFNQQAVDKYKIDIHDYKKKALVISIGEDDILSTTTIFLIKRIFQIAIIGLFITLIFAIIRMKRYKKEVLKYQRIHSEISDKSLQYILLVDTKTGVILDFNMKVAKSDFRDYLVKNETKITDLFPPQIVEILNQKGEESYFQIHEIDFKTKKISFPTMMASLNYVDDEQELSLIQFINNSKLKHELMQLKKMKDDAENRVHESTNLIDNFVREIRDPLNVKRGFEHLIENEELTPHQKEKYQAIIKSNSQRLLSQVEKILIFSELNNNTRILNNQEFSVNNQIRKIINLTQQANQEKGLNLKIVNYFSLSEGKDVLFNDKDYFCLVFQELLDNAVKFTQNGVIECGYTHPNDGKIIFYIKDNGIGMSAEEQRLAFNKFNNKYNSNLKTSLPGIGIGLAICRNIITKMGGNIWLTSNEKQGTTVYFYLDYDMSIFNETQSAPHQSDISRIQKKNILIIDEDMGSQKYISQALTRYNIKARTMPNYQFYKKYRDTNKEFDFIFIDNESGFEDFYHDHLDMLKEHKVSLVIMTRVIIDGEITSSLNGVNYTILYKPIKLHEMIRTLIDLTK